MRAVAFRAKSFLDLSAPGSSRRCRPRTLRTVERERVHPEPALMSHASHGPIDSGPDPRTCSLDLGGIRSGSDDRPGSGLSAMSVLARLVLVGASQSLANVWYGEPTDLQEQLVEIARDERVTGVAACDADLNPKSHRDFRKSFVARQLEGAFVQLMSIKVLPAHCRNGVRSPVCPRAGSMSARCLLQTRSKCWALQFWSTILAILIGEKLRLELLSSLALGCLRFSLLACRWVWRDGRATTGVWNCALCRCSPRCKVPTLFC